MQINTRVSGFKLGTDIRKVTVPEKLRIRQSLGIQWMNDALGGGGMTPSTVMMLTGSPGCGKSTLLRQLADSVSAEGHVAVLNTGEESVYQVKMRCEDMGLQHGFQVGQEVYTDKLLAYVKDLQKKETKRQVFLFQDSLQTLNDGHYRNGGSTGMTPVRCCEQLTDWAKETYGIAVFVGQVTKSGVFAGKNTIRHMVDVHTEVLHDMDPRSDTYRKLVLTVTKNRFGYTGKQYLVALGKQGMYSVQDLEEVDRPNEEDDDEGTTVVPVSEAPKRTVSGIDVKVPGAPPVAREG